MLYRGEGGRGVSVVSVVGHAWYLVLASPASTNLTAQLVLGFSHIEHVDPGP